MSSADVHGSATQHDGQKGASEPKTTGDHVSEGWHNNNPFVALSPDHGVDKADETDELNSRDGSRGGGRQDQTEMPTFQPETRTDAKAEGQPDTGPDALRRRSRTAPLPGEFLPPCNMQYNRLF
jgi:hypothetical protein